MDDIKQDIDTGQPVPKPAAPKKPKAKKIFAIILPVVLIIAAGAGGYFWKDKGSKKAIEQSRSELTVLQAQVGQLEKDLATAKADAAKAKKSETAKVPSQDTLDNVEQSITSGNTAALEGYLADKVLVIIAASEGVGVRTPAQAVSDVTDYIKDAKDPWNFSLPNATITEYSTGDYAQYFPSGALVGESDDSMVISFTFNSSGDVSVIFLAADSSLL